VPAHIPIINVIDPVVAAVAQTYRTQSTPPNVGVIGTRGTIGSGIYPARISAAGVPGTVHALATPLLVPIIEEGLAHSEILRATLHHYLAQPDLQGINTLIPGCTHYPLLTDEINAFYRDHLHAPIAIIGVEFVPVVGKALDATGASAASSEMD
jgi:glutamate racemase